MSLRSLSFGLASGALLLFVAACGDQPAPEAPSDTANTALDTMATSLDTGTARQDTAAARLDTSAAPPTASRNTNGSSSGSPTGANASSGNSSGIDTTGAGPASIPQNRYTTTGSGLKYYDLEEGSGASPDASDRVRVHYTGWLQSNGEKFDSSYDRGAPATFPLNRVIRGWTEGLQSMQVGGTRQLVVPSELGYGQRGTPDGSIPPGATLVFEVKLLGIEGAS